MPRVTACYAPQQSDCGAYWRRPIALPAERSFVELVKELDSTVRPELAAKLFLCVRSVRNWADIAPVDHAKSQEPRRGGFRLVTVGPSPISEALLVLRKLTRHGEHGETVGAIEAAKACRTVAKWAARRELPITALHFAEACAALVPQSPRALNLAARMNRLLGESRRAEVYYERAINFARRKSKWAQYVRGNLGLGTIRAGEGKVQVAIKHFHAAARAAKSESGERWLAARTAHDLLLLQADLGLFLAAVETAIRCLEWYGVHNPRFPAVVHDIGMLFVRQGRPEIALPLIKLVIHAKIPPADQALGWSTYARALASLGDKSGYLDAAEEARLRADRYPVHCAAVFNNLAFGAQALGLWDQAATFVAEGARWAVLGTAEADDAVRLQVDISAQRKLGPLSNEPLVGEPWDRLFPLLSDLPRRMAAWRGPTLTKRHKDGPPPDVEF